MASSDLILLLQVPMFFRSSFILKCHTFRASQGQYTMIKIFHNLLVPVSFGGLKNTFLLIGWPCRMADLMSNDFSFHLSDGVTDRINLKFSLHESAITPSLPTYLRLIALPFTLPQILYGLRSSAAFSFLFQKSQHYCKI